MVRVRDFDKHEGINWCENCIHDRNKDKKVCHMLEVPIYDGNGKLIGKAYDMTKCSTPDNSVAPNHFKDKRRKRR